MPHLKAVVYCRPTAANVTRICAELSERRRYAEYHLFFSNTLPTNLLSQLAAADPMSLVRQVQEFPLDFIPINPDLYTLNLRGSIPMSTAINTAREQSHVNVMGREVAGERLKCKRTGREQGEQD